MVRWEGERKTGGDGRLDRRGQAQLALFDEGAPAYSLGSFRVLRVRSSCPGSPTTVPVSAFLSVLREAFANFDRVKGLSPASSTRLFRCDFEAVILPNDRTKKNGSRESPPERLLSDCSSGTTPRPPDAGSVLQSVPSAHCPFR